MVIYQSCGWLFPITLKVNNDILVKLADWFSVIFIYQSILQIIHVFKLKLPSVRSRVLIFFPS
jgi:hypothetical protein